MLMDHTGKPSSMPAARFKASKKKIVVEQKKFTLADDLMARGGSERIHSRQFEEKLQGLIRRAHRFVLTEDAARKVALAIQSYPEMLVEHGQFARAPFENCWIEFPTTEFFETLVPGSGNQPGADIRVGYLFSGNNVYVGAQRAEGVGGFSPIEYHLHQPMSLQNELAMADAMGVSRMGLDDFFWGRSFSRDLSLETKRGLRRQHDFSMRIDPARVNNKIDYSVLLNSMNGEVRNILGILLMINQPNKNFTITERTASRAMSHRGMRAQMSHNVVSINLDDNDLSTLFRVDRPKGTHASPRLHPVRGHYCHDRRAKMMSKIGCQHEWNEITPLKWECTRCTGRRWWRKEHSRGDASLGQIEQEHAVITDRDRHIVRY